MSIEDWAGFGLMVACAILYFYFAIRTMKARIDYEKRSKEMQEIASDYNYYQEWVNKHTLKDNEIMRDSLKTISSIYVDLNKANLTPDATKLAKRSFIAKETLKKLED
ncbi:DASS family transporter [Weissella oryzae SG25]|uniref:DASS family transporter n=1 Tax=Weissella oryzae (strain DSM 25784 / JCM 18191 / LMG 30913 / SG25) TaxID=1329250 RepID=A0A069D073_WEIOS|nr:hypothetical protein [Weissella oryzae]GAK30721.1 DASS family transporter [Weissella oryzae SG25]